MASDMILQARAELWGEAIANDQLFFGSASSSAVGAQYGAIQLLNPTGSGKVVYVAYILITPNSANAQTFRIGAYNTALTNNATTLASMSFGSGKSPVAQLRSETAAGQKLTTFGGEVLVAGNSTLIIPQQVHFPWRLEPGTGLIVENATVNQPGLHTFGWIETDGRLT